MASFASVSPFAMACAVPASIHFRLTAYSAISLTMDSSAETTPMMADAVI